PDATDPREARWVSAVGRLRAGATVEAAQSELATISSRLAREYPASNRDVSVLVEPRLVAETGDVRPLLLVAWGMVALVLVIVATNLANLQLARATEREGEVAVRAALGAPRTALARQFLVESAMLGLVGGVLGSALAVAALPLIRQVGGIGVPRLETLSLDPWMLAYSVTLSLAIGIAFGIAPALSAARLRPAGALRRSGRGSVSRGRERVRAALIVAQMALAAVVLVAAGLLLRSFDRLSRVEPGFTIERGVTFRVAPDWGTYPQRSKAVRLYDDLLARLAAIPGVTGVAAVNRLPLTGGWWTTDYLQEGAVVESGREQHAGYRVVTASYFSTMGIAL